MDPIKLVIIEDKKYFSEHLISILSSNPNIKEIKSFPSAEACSDAEIKNTDLFLIDIVLPGISGIDFLEKIYQVNPKSKKIMLTILESEDAIFQCLKRGCAGYVLKTDIDKIQEIIQITLEGGSYMTPSIAVHVIKFFHKIKDVPTHKPLTSKESQILKELSSGSSPIEIASLLVVNISTIRFHIRGIYEKLEVNNRAQMLKMADKLGLL